VRTGTEGRALAFLRLDRALEALDRGQELVAGGHAVQLDPPAWLILPQRDAAGTQD
jgi:tRNA-modifying protein YgfZ